MCPNLPPLLTKDDKRSPVLISPRQIGHFSLYKRENRAPRLSHTRPDAQPCRCILLLREERMRVIVSKSGGKLFDLPPSTDTATGTSCPIYRPRLEHPHGLYSSSGLRTASFITPIEIDERTSEHGWTQLPLTGLVMSWMR